MNSYTFYPGCSAETTGRAYTESFKYVANQIGLTINEIEDWNCCGSTVAAGADPQLADALPARNLALAEQQHGEDPVLTLCAGCYQNLRRALVHTRRSEDDQRRVSNLIAMPYEAKAEVYNGIEPFLEDDVADAVREKVVAPLKDMKVACYYGCMLLRPLDLVSFDDEEQPTTMEQVVELAGATPIEWAFKNECCGASHQVSMAKQSKPLIARIFDDAARNGAEAIACACPLCMLNLDMRQAEVNQRRRAQGLPEYDIPVYYFTELLASAMGAQPKESGITRHFHPAVQLVSDAMERGVAAVFEEKNKPKLSPEEEAFEKKLAAMDPEKAAKVRAAHEAKKRKAQAVAAEGAATAPETQEG